MFDSSPMGESKSHRAGPCSIHWKIGLVTECIGVVRLADLLATGLMLRTTMVVMAGGERFDAGCRVSQGDGQVW